MTKVVERESYIRITTDIQNRALTGELWGVYCEDCGGNWPCYNSTALYWLTGVWCYTRSLLNATELWWWVTWSVTSENSGAMVAFKSNLWVSHTKHLLYHIQHNNRNCYVTIIFYSMARSIKYSKFICWFKSKGSYICEIIIPHRVAIYCIFTQWDKKNIHYSQWGFRDFQAIWLAVLTTPNKLGLFWGSSSNVIFLAWNKLFGGGGG